jgi:hypothetical protein
MPFGTPMLQDFLNDNKMKRSRRKTHFPFGRFGEGVEQARAAVSLVTNKSTFENATDFVVDNGLTKAYVAKEGMTFVDPETRDTRYLRCCLCICATC